MSCVPNDGWMVIDSNMMAMVKRRVHKTLNALHIARPDEASVLCDYDSIVRMFGPMID